MKIMLDTNAYSFIMQKHLPLLDIIEHAEYIHLPATVLGELYAGFRMGNKFEQNCALLEDFFMLPGVSIVDTDKNIAERYGILIKQLKEAGTPLPVNDIWIAAAALETGSRVVTYDSHFKMIPGIVVISP
ncbi:MAG: type II toxin-antitoxin system VapC family toxin [Spirochaetales bacterium]|nr:type II toxin-antitoxin system VapC family toxin [Spirochaetales bacterium]